MIWLILAGKIFSSITFGESGAIRRGRSVRVQRGVARSGENSRSRDRAGLVRNFGRKRRRVGLKSEVEKLEKNEKIEKISKKSKNLENAENARKR